MNIKETMIKIHENNVEKGFWQDKATKNVGEVLMLCVSELSEALEAHRKGKTKALPAFNSAMEYVGLKIEDFNKENPNIFWIKNRFETTVKDTFEDEIADTVIRIFDLCEGFGIDLETHIRLKLEYNKTRPFKHDKAY